MSHTPGPWTHGIELHCYTDGTTKTYGGDQVYAGNYAVCQVYNLWTNATVEEMADEPTLQVCLANARLIAAAPELLEALKRIVDRGLEAGDCGDHCSNACMYCWARAAIAKAEGRAG